MYAPAALSEMLHALGAPAELRSDVGLCIILQSGCCPSSGNHSPAASCPSLQVPSPERHKVHPALASIESIGSLLIVSCHRPDKPFETLGAPRLDLRLAIQAGRLHRR
jgi:hypothetical protein